MAADAGCSGRGGRSATERSRHCVALFVYNAIDTRFFVSRQSLIFILLRQAAPIAIVAVGMAHRHRHRRASTCRWGR